MARLLSPGSPSQCGGNPIPVPIHTFSIFPNSVRSPPSMFGEIAVHFVRLLCALIMFGRGGGIFFTSSFSCCWFAPSTTRSHATEF